MRPQPARIHNNTEEEATTVLGSASELQRRQAGRRAFTPDQLGHVFGRVNGSDAVICQLER
jgi:hypothetical protein